LSTKQNESCCQAHAPPMMLPSLVLNIVVFVKENYCFNIYPFISLSNTFPQCYYNIYCFTQ